jgi:hypothetical protein
MFRLIAIDFSQKSPHFSLLSPTSPYELSEREVTSPSNLKVVRALDNYSLESGKANHPNCQYKGYPHCSIQASTLTYSSTCPFGQLTKKSKNIASYL